MPMMRGVAARLVMLAVLVTSLAGGVDSASAVLPGENGKIAFASARDGNKEIYVVNPDTTGQVRLTTDPGTDADPAWSPDGKRIAFTTTRNGNDDVYVMNADGSGEFQLTSAPANDQSASWSPGGRNLAFVSNRDGDAEIFVMNEDGTGQTQLTHNDGPSDAVPAWSPDGARIAFNSTRDGNSEIYVMEVDGTDVTRLTSVPGDDVSPSWSPDGDQIAFASNRDGSYEVYVMDADGTDQTRLTRNLETDLDPAWSPDGRFLCFTSNRDANYEIYVMGSDGTAQTRLTTSQDEDTTCDWQWQRVVLPPPQPLDEDEVLFSVRWKESQSLGVLQIGGRVPGLSKLQLALRRGKQIRLAVGLTLAKGAFSKKLALPRDLVPGLYRLDVSAVGSPTELSPQRISIRLVAPPEGVASEAWASTTVEGPPLQRIPATNSIAWAHFRLVALPWPGRRLVTHWRLDPKPGPTPIPRFKPRTSPVIAWISNEGEPLPRGTYTCTLTAGTKVVKRLTFRVI